MATRFLCREDEDRRNKGVNITVSTLNIIEPERNFWKKPATHVMDLWAAYPTILCSGVSIENQLQNKSQENREPPKSCITQHHTTSELGRNILISIL